ncbi:MAG: zinc ribbon domain-containing protein [Candidatus Viridilinea halotolerans]|uniref:Zinc ribbon domain-containing protein n=1 Tax=Candidatus Viridilinea halotolerans TaxID=2491704 RepID=A0A426TRC4_9CHLR|nr:MAG: zinc ribbon domain-containing protein [Candidatus Viridilinea halotolerans]
MPMYEYGCLACDSHFDALRRMDQDDSGVVCPQCGASQVQRRLSVFASHSRDGGSARVTEAAPPALGGGCGGGCCSGTCATRN